MASVQKKQRNSAFGVFELGAALKKPKPLQFRLFDENSYRQLKRAREGRQKDDSRVVRHSSILQEQRHVTRNGQSYLPIRQDSDVGLPNQTASAISSIEVVACQPHLSCESPFDMACLATQRSHQTPREVHTPALASQETLAILDIVRRISREHYRSSSATTEPSLADAGIDCTAEIDAFNHQLKEPDVAGLSALDTVDGDDMPAGPISNSGFPTISNKVAKTSSEVAERRRQASFRDSKYFTIPTGSAEPPQTISNGRQTRGDELSFWTSQRDKDLLHFHDIVQLRWHEIEAYFPEISKTQVLSRYHFLRRRDEPTRNGAILRSRAVPNHMTEISLSKANERKPRARSRADRNSVCCSSVNQALKSEVTSVSIKEQNRDSASNTKPLRTSRSGRHIRAPLRRPDEGYQMP